MNAARKSGANIVYYVAHVDYIQYISGLKPIREGVILVCLTATTAAGELRAYATIVGMGITYPPTWLCDPHTLRWSAPGLRPLASAAFGHGDRLGILRVHGALVIHVVLHNNNKCALVLQYLVVRYCSTSLQYCSNGGTPCLAKY